MQILGGAYLRERVYSRGFFKVWHVPQRLTNKQSNFLNPLSLKVTTRPFNFYIVISKFIFASASLAPVLQYLARYHFATTLPSNKAPCSFLFDRGLLTKMISEVGVYLKGVFEEGDLKGVFI